MTKKNRYPNPFKPIKIKTPHFHLDTDRDGVLDYRDCRPFNPRKQHDDSNDWMNPNKQKPETEQQDTNMYINGIPITPETEDLLKEALKIFQEEEGIVDLGEILYKNYKIRLTTYPNGLEVGPYEGHPTTDIYLPNIVYATAFEQDPSNPFKRGQRAGVGKTKQEAIRNAKKWVDKQPRR